MEFFLVSAEVREYLLEQFLGNLDIHNESFMSYIQSSAFRFHCTWKLVSVPTLYSVIACRRIIAGRQAKWQRTHK